MAKFVEVIPSPTVMGFRMLINIDAILTIMGNENGSVIKFGENNQVSVQETIEELGVLINPADDAMGSNERGYLEARSSPHPPARIRPRGPKL